MSAAEAGRASKRLTSEVLLHPDFVSELRFCSSRGAGVGGAVRVVGVGEARPGPRSAAVGLLEFRQFRVGEASGFGLRVSRVWHVVEVEP